MTERFLVQWIGHSDLRAMARDLAPADRQAVLCRIGGEASAVGDDGPSKTLLRHERFDGIKLLSNYPGEFNAWFQAWIGGPAEVVSVQLDSPTDYVSIYRSADQVLKQLKHAVKSGATQLCLHLSPGTPAMAAVWLLLGKTRYPATFYETYAGTSKVVSVPFELTVDLLPDVLRSADSFWDHLAVQCPHELAGFEHVVGESRVLREAVGRAKRVALRNISTLLLGESGTGKELFARAIHQASPRRGKPFVAINCATLSATLLESELFGHTKGAFTGADRDRAGAFEQAHGGTLFLDEVGECDLRARKAVAISHPGRR